MNVHLHRRETLGLIFAVAGGASAWTLQLWLSWTLSEPLCSVGPADFTLARLDTGALWLIVGLLSSVFAAAALLVSLALWRSSPAGTEARRAGHPPRRFVAYLGVLLNGLFLLTILLGTTSPFFLEACT